MIKKNIFLPVLVLFFFAQVISAQIHVNNAGSVGIGTETISSDTKLKLSFSGSSSETYYYGIYGETINSPSTYTYGIFLNLANNTKRTYGCQIIGSYMGVLGSTDNSTNTTMTSRYGVYGKGNGNSSANYAYGVRGYAVGANWVTYGIYGSTDGSGSSNNYAGYFNGNVKVTGSVTCTGFSNLSDKKFKEDIKELGSVIDNIKKLKSKKYKFKKNKKMHLPEGENYGFLAQDLEGIFPELVKEETDIIFEDGDNDPLKENADANGNLAPPEVITYKTANYIQLIPILVKGLQEQQEMIDDLQKRVEKLEKK